MILPYNTSHYKELLSLMDMNTPEYFHPDEKADFVYYLKEEIEDYFVFIEKNKVIGSGGINYFPSKNKARISWDFVHPEYHGKGVGSKLVQHRIQHILKQSINKIEVRTSQLAYKFYEKQGFELLTTEKDFWGEGFDLYQMEYEL